MSKINILQICNQLGIGGAEKCLQIFTENLDKNIFNVYVCGIKQGGERGNLLHLKKPPSLKVVMACAWHG